MTAEPQDKRRVRRSRCCSAVKRSINRSRRLDKSSLGTARTSIASKSGMSDTPYAAEIGPADRRRLRRAPPPPCLFACSLGICTCGLKQAGASSWRFPLGVGAGFLGHPGASWGFLGSGSKPEGARKQAKSRPEATQGPSGGNQGQADAKIGAGSEIR